MKDIYQTDHNGYPHGYIELYHRDENGHAIHIALRGYRWHRFNVGYNESHWWDSHYNNIHGMVYYSIR